MPLADLRRQCEQPLPHPAPEELARNAKAIEEFLYEDFTTLPERSVGRTAGLREMDARLREPPPENGQPFERVLETLREHVVPLCYRPQHPRFVAFIPGAPSFYSVMGDWLCAGLNIFTGVWKEAPGAAQVEILVLDWFKQFLGMPASARGVLTGGGSEANLVAMVTAREPLPAADRGRAVIYLSEQRHWSIDRAAKVMGLAREQIRPLPTDRLFRLELAALRPAIAADRQAARLPWLVVANAGATNTGSVDPLAEIAAVCAQEKLWLHVDGAYGWPAVLTEEGRAELRGIEQADSITLDPHKWFAQPFGTGCVLVREGRLLGETFHLRPDYMQDVTPAEEVYNFADHGIALTRRFRALKIWFSLKVLGVSWFRRLVEHSCRLADYTQALLEQAGCFEVLCPRQLSVVCFRYVPPGSAGDLDALNLNLCEAARASGKMFLSTTRLDGRVALRFCYVNWRTIAADVEIMVNLLAELGERICKGGI